MNEEVLSHLDSGLRNNFNNLLFDEITRGVNNELYETLGDHIIPTLWIELFIELEHDLDEEIFYL